jgi:hypothetical protein
MLIGATHGAMVWSLVSAFDRIARPGLSSDYKQRELSASIERATMFQWTGFPLGGLLVVGGGGVLVSDWLRRRRERAKPDP